MQNLFKTIICLLLFFVIGVSCSKKENTDSKSTTEIIKAPINPNGDSELALLMRAMFDEAERIKQQIKNEEPVSFNLDHKKILTAHATEPEKAASPEYKAFAKVYLQTINSLQNAEPEQIATLYDNMVSNCMTCHKALCPGPIVKIKKLQ